MHSLLSLGPLQQRILSRVLLPYSKQVQMCDLRQTWLGLNKGVLQKARLLLNGDTAPPPSLLLLSPASPREAEMLICITSPELPESILLPSAQQWLWFMAVPGPGLGATALAVGNGMVQKLVDRNPRGKGHTKPRNRNRAKKEETKGPIESGSFCPQLKNQRS